MSVTNMFVQLTKAKQNLDRPVLRRVFMDEVTSLTSLRFSKLLFNLYVLCLHKPALGVLLSLYISVCVNLH
jgi:hypothetical protein